MKTKNWPHSNSGTKYRKFDVGENISWDLRSAMLHSKIWMSRLCLKVTSLLKSLEQWNRFAMLRIGLPLVCRAVLLRSKIISWSPWQRANWPLDAAVVGLDQCDRVCANAKTDQGKLLWRTLRTWPLKNVYLTIFRISYYKTSLIWRLGIDSWIDYT